ncbi:carboxypeptidase-like regulatory domain-containing protein [Mucilaginibacter sp. 3215]|uniref:carboxypeptidase-like regulatory domain-containing protein n=1 Tax=Mucilaginibacter sp. 3215 TaxID=3373912 RepID=UPI003D1B087E
MPQQFSISGKITNQEGKPVPFASVFIKNTTIGVSANSEGTYLLRLNGGLQEIQYKAVGYAQQSKIVNLAANQVINISLQTETYQLKDVTVYAGAEDPAYAIMRKAIKKRKTYLNEVKAYTCDIYIKGLQKQNFHGF